MNRLAGKLEVMNEALDVAEIESKKPKLIKKFYRRGEPNCVYYKQMKWRGMHFRVDRIGDSFFVTKNDRLVQITEIFQNLSDNNIYVSGN